MSTPNTSVMGTANLTLTSELRYWIGALHSVPLNHFTHLVHIREMNGASNRL